MIGCVKNFSNRQDRGDYTEITCFDTADNMVSPEAADRIRIREMLANGEVIRETWVLREEMIEKTA